MRPSGVENYALCNETKLGVGEERVKRPSFPVCAREVPKRL